MTRRQWTKVGELFTKAAGLEPAHRQAYLKKATQDPEIRREVEKLLAQHDKHENILGVYSSLGGKVLSHYKVGPTIGSGGLGLIYKARDIRLNRWVALKVLHPWAMGHSGFRERLIKEAQSTSVLNHPNIVTIYEVGHENEVHFIAMEYVIGKTLDLVIPPKGLPV